MPIVQQRRGTAAELALANETPAAGQIVFEIDTNRMKVGNGTDAYNDLAYITDSTTIAEIDGLQAALDANAAAAAAAQSSADGLGGLFAQHKSRHSISGVDPLSPADIGAAPDSVVSRVSTNEGDIALARADITQLINTYVDQTDARLTDARTPTSHASSHHSGGSDPITPASIGAQPAGSYATLVNGLVPSSQLPGYVDDVIEASAVASFPATGETDKIYVDTSTNKAYRWGGTSYVEISASPGSTDAVPEGSVNLYFTDARAQNALASDLNAKADTAGDTFTGDVSIGDGNTQSSLRFATHSNQFDANATDLDYISLYKNGTTVAGLGITTSNFNVGTNGAINYSLYAHGTLVQRSNSTLSRYYVDQFHNGRLYTAAGTAALPVISREGDSDTGVYYPAFDQWAVAIGGSEQLHVTSTSLEVNSGAVYSPLYRTNSDGTVGNVAYGRTGDPDTGVFFAGADTLAFASGGTERLRADASGLSTNQPFTSTNAIAAASGLLSSCGFQFSSDSDTGLVRLSANTMALVAGATAKITVSTTGTTIAGDATSDGLVSANRFETDSIGSASAPAFAIDNPNGVSGTGWFTPASLVNGGNGAGYGFAIATGGQQKAEFGYKSWIGPSRPTYYGGGEAALLELNGNSRRGSLFAYTTYNTLSTMANNARCGEFVQYVYGGNTSNWTAALTAKNENYAANNFNSIGLDVQSRMWAMTGSTTSQIGISVDVSAAAQSTGSLDGLYGLYIDAMSPGGMSLGTDGTTGAAKQFAIYQAGASDSNYWRGEHYFRGTGNFYADIEMKAGKILLDSAWGYAPALAFTNDQNTGIKQAPNGNFDIQTAGVNRFSITQAGDIHTGSGGTTYVNNTLSIANGLALTELQAGGAATNDVLTWNGTAWVPAAGGGGGGSTTLAGLTDTNIASAQAGEYLRHDGTNWVDAAISIADVTNLQTTLDGKIDSSGDIMTGDLEMTRDVPASETNGTAWGYRVNRPAGSGTLTNAFGLNVPSNFDFATNNFGVRLVNNLSSGKNCYAIYAAGTAYNYLRGNTGIGTFPTSNQLEVAGTTRLNGTTYISAGSNTAAGLAFDGDPDCGLYRAATDTIGILGGTSQILHSPYQTVISSPTVYSNWNANGNTAVWAFNSPASSNTAVELQLEGFTLTTYSSTSTSTVNAIGANGTVLNFPGDTQHNTPTAGEFRFSFNNNIRHTLHNNGATIGGTLEATAISDGTTTETVSNLLARVKSDTTQAGGGTAVNNVVVISQAAYTALATKDANTLYFIT